MEAGTLIVKKMKENSRINNVNNGGKAMLVMKARWHAHPTESQDRLEEVRVKTVEQLGKRLAILLNESLLAEWGYYHKRYCSVLHLDISNEYGDDELEADLKLMEGENLKEGILKEVKNGS